MADEQFSRRAGLNLVTELSYVVIATLIGLLLVPYYIDQLGVSAYAIIPLATSVTSYVLVISDAFCSAINRYLIVPLQKGDYEEASTIFSTATFFIGKTAAMMLPLVITLSFLSPVIFNTGESSSQSVILLFFSVLSAALMVSFGSVFLNSVMASNKMYLVNGVKMSQQLIQVGMIITLFIAYGPTLEIIGISYIVSASIYFPAAFILMKREYPKMKCSLSYYNKQRVKDISNLSLWSTVNSVGSLLFLQASLIIANIMLGSTEEGRYSLVVTMVSMIGTTTMAFLNVFYPFLYKYFSDDDMDGVMDTINVAIKVMTIIFALPIAFLCVYSKVVLGTWLGGGFEDLSIIIWIMMIPLTLQSALSAIYFVPTMLLKVRGIALLTLFFGAINIAGSVIVCALGYGIEGLALVWSVTMTARSCIVSPLYVCRLMKIGVSSILKNGIVCTVLFALSLLSLYVIEQFYSPSCSYLSIAIFSLALYVPYLIVCIRLIMTKEERIMISYTIPPKLVNFYCKLAGISKS